MSCSRSLPPPTLLGFCCTLLRFHFTPEKGKCFTRQTLILLCPVWLMNPLWNYSVYRTELGSGSPLFQVWSLSRGWKFRSHPQTSLELCSKWEFLLLQDPQHCANNTNDFQEDYKWVIILWFISVKPLALAGGSFSAKQDYFSPFRDKQLKHKPHPKQTTLTPLLTLISQFISLLINPPSSQEQKPKPHF